MKIKILSAVLVTVLIFSVFTFEAGAETELPDLSKVQNVYVYNMENGRELYSKASDEKVAPASTVKIMTGLIAVEHFKDNYGQMITVTKDALGDFKGKNINLKNEETVTVENLLYAVICGGANDAANVLAYEIAGSHGAFLNMMNDRAKELGMNNTHYTNANGYSDSSMYTTAEDTMLLAKYVYLVQDYMNICMEERYVFPQTNISKTRYIFNSSYLISTNIETKYKNKEAKGINAGSTFEGGHVLVTAVTRDGMTNLFVLMGGQSDEENIYTYEAANNLIDWSYESFEYKKILDSGEMICEIDVNLSNQADYVVLSPARAVEYFLPVSVDIEKDITRTVELYENTLEAPVEAGYVAGTITLTYEGNVIDKVDLVTKNNVDRNGFLYVLARIKNFTGSQKFKIGVLCAAGIFVLYIISVIYRKTKSNRYRYKYNRYRRR